MANERLRCLHEAGAALVEVCLLALTAYTSLVFASVFCTAAFRRALHQRGDSLRTQHSPQIDVSSLHLGRHMIDGLNTHVFLQ
jgi:hypothetical protein